MNIQALKYIVQIEKMGSINKAAQSLFISQPTLSRAVKDIETTINITLFQRSNKGIVPTHDGKKFIDEVKDLMKRFDDLEDQYLTSNRNIALTLTVATQRYSAVIEAFLHFYQKECTDKEYINIAIQEENTENIIRLVGSQIYNLGILHYTNDSEERIMQACKNLDLEHHLVTESPVCVQLRRGHPLSRRKAISLNMLSSYPHVTFADEDITSINYCSDIFQYNQNILKKRIVVQDRGTLRQVLGRTDSYYLGCDLSNCNTRHFPDLVYIPFKDTNLTIKTIWVQRRGRTLKEPERHFISILNEILSNGCNTTVKE